MFERLGNETVMICYLAGYESQYRYIDIIPNMSVFCTAHAFNPTDKCLTFIKDNRKSFNKVTVDSGAFSFMNAAGLFKEGAKTMPLKETMDAFLLKYISLIKKHYDTIDYFIELDVQKLIGLNAVKKYRQIFRAEGLEDKLLYVLHYEDGQKEWDWVIKNSKPKYVCFESIRKNMGVLPYGRLIKQCYDADVKVHALAMTKPDFCKQYPFYSVDSSRWLNVIKYGEVGYFEKSTGLLKCIKGNKLKLKEWNLPAQLSSCQRTKDDSAFKLQLAAWQYIEMEKYMTDLWNQRGIKWA